MKFSNYMCVSYVRKTLARKKSGLMLLQIQMQSQNRQKNSQMKPNLVNEIYK